MKSALEKDEALPPLYEEVLERPLLGQIILLCNMGSISHGTHNPDPESIDDIDVMGAVVPSLDYYFGFERFGSRDTMEIKEGRFDIVLYEARKFVGLLAKGNPNVIGTLFLKPEFYLLITPEGEMLIRERNRFLTQNLVHSMLGYANDQLRRVDKSLKLNPGYRGYMGAKRKKLVEEYGYDTKYASHLIRLLRMCREFIETRELNVYRDKDSQNLRDIKTGKYKFEYVEREAANLFRECSEKLYMIADLPVAPDKDFLNELAVRIISRRLAGGR